MCVCVCVCVYLYIRLFVIFYCGERGGRRAVRGMHTHILCIICIGLTRCIGPRLYGVSLFTDMLPLSFLLGCGARVNPSSIL